MVITGLTRKIRSQRSERPRTFPTAQEILRDRIFKTSYRSCVLSCFFPKQDIHMRYTESCPSGRRCSTRNAVYRNVPRVRIPNSPPKKSEKSRFFGLFFFARLLKICSKLWKEQPVFWKEQGDFGYFGIFEPLKSVLSAIV